MSIHVHFLRPDFAVARVFLERPELELGATDRDAALVAMPTGGGRRALYDKTGQRIHSARIVAAIDRDRRIAEQQHRAITQHA